MLLYRQCVFMKIGNARNCAIRHMMIQVYIQYLTPLMPDLHFI